MLPAGCFIEAWIINLLAINREIMNTDYFITCTQNASVFCSCLNKNLIEDKNLFFIANQNFTFE